VTTLQVLSARYSDVSSLYELGMFLLFIRGVEDLPLDASDSLWESLVISQFEKDSAFFPSPHYDDSPG